MRVRLRRILSVRDAQDDSSDFSVLSVEREHVTDMETLDCEEGAKILVDAVVAKSTRTTSGLNPKADATMVYMHSTRGTTHLGDLESDSRFACQRHSLAHNIWLKEVDAARAQWPRCGDCFLIEAYVSAKVGPPADLWSASGPC